ncbi:MAG TPA: discoidin domain-containing protein [Phycisphaerae bacterium]|nr:discoidin domain-containing protein [Phycisphaerae bacterium]
MVARMWACLLATAAAGPSVQPDKPNVVRFPAAEARFVRFVVHSSVRGQPCLDELEVCGPDGKGNLALAKGGAKATASSCLPGYAIHQVAHLNDGLYGNDHSWIAASDRDEWAQIELPRPAAVGGVVFSRDRAGRYRDRLPAHFEVRVSLDGRTWRTVKEVKVELPPPPPPPPPPRPHPDQVAAAEALNRGDLLAYAFLCEKHTWRALDGADPVGRVLGQMEEMLARLAGKGLDVSGERAELAELRQPHRQFLAASPPDASAERAIFLAARRAKRRLFFREPDLAAVERVLFVKRHPFEPSHNYSVILDARGGPGGAVCVLEVPRSDGRLVPEKATVRRLFEAGEGVARNPAASFDARRLYFAHRASGRGYFHIMAMDSDGRNVRQLTDGPFHDYWPCPIGDGGLAFISTRCKARFLCWRPQAFVLFRMDADGGSIRPLSHANLSEWSPAPMRDGRVLWMRSEYLDKGADFGHTLWAIRPDGTHPELVFGNNTLHCYANGREVPGTSEICCTLVSHGGDLNGPIALIDLRKGPFDPAAIRSITPDARAHYHMSWARRECFRDPVPLSRDYFLCSHAPDDRFGLYVIDRYGNRELLHLDPAIGSMCPTPLRAVARPPALSESVEAPVPGDEPEPGVFVLADVYQGLAPAVARGHVRYLRVCEEVRSDLARLPNGEYQQDHPAFEDWYATPVHKVRGPHGWPSYVAKGTFGLVPVEADGSACFYAPAGKVLYFQALDGDFNELQRMRSVVQLQPGERRGCIGCHEHRSAAPPVGRVQALRRGPVRLEPPPWGAGPMAYERVVQPVWDAKCVRCHNAAHKRGYDLTAKLDGEKVPASYRTIISRGWVHYFDYTWGREHHKADPMTFGSLQSRLWQVLAAGHNQVKLSPDEARRVKCWTDLNCPLWPDYTYRPDRAVVPKAADAQAGR